MAWILNALQSVQDAVHSSTPAPKAACELVLPELKKLNDSVYELCKPLVPRVGRPSVEIVFFHGLQFDGSDTTYLTTWLSNDGQETWLLWIFEFFPEARILLISYNGCIKQKVDAGCTYMYITSENLWQDMIDDNAKVGQDGCPVVLVGHSLGGLVIKEVLLKANSMLNSNPRGRNKENLGYLLQNVKHLFYYSCPHNGTRLADMQTKVLNGLLFQNLTTLNKEAARCNEAFRMLRENSKWEAYSIVEALPTDLVSTDYFLPTILLNESDNKSLIELSPCPLHFSPTLWTQGDKKDGIRLSSCPLGSHMRIGKEFTVFANLEDCVRSAKLCQLSHGSQMPSN